MLSASFLILALLTSSAAALGCKSVTSVKNHSLGVGTQESGDYTNTELTMDIYSCDSKGNSSHPLLIFFPGGGVDKSYYSTFSATAVRHGYVVAVISHLIPFGGGMANFISPVDVQRVIGAFEDGEFTADTSSIALVGHSVGSVGVLMSISGSCPFPFCGHPTDAPEVTAELPASVKAAAVFAGSIVDGSGQAFNVNNRRTVGDNDSTVPFLFVGPELEKIVDEVDESTNKTDLETSYAGMEPTRAYVILEDLDHNSIQDDYHGSFERNVRNSTLPRSQQIDAASRAILDWLSFAVAKNSSSGYFDAAGYCESLPPSFNVLECNYDPETTIEATIDALYRLSHDIETKVERGIVSEKRSEKMLRRIDNTVKRLQSAASPENSEAKQLRIATRVCDKSMERLANRVAQGANRGWIDVNTATLWEEMIGDVCKFLSS